MTNIERTHHLTKVLGPRDAEEPVKILQFSLPLTAAKQQGGMGPMKRLI